MTTGSIEPAQDNTCSLCEKRSSNVETSGSRCNGVASVPIKSKFLYRMQFALRVALLIILPACLFSTNYGRSAGGPLSCSFFRTFPEIFSYYAVVASAAFLTIREKGCLESTRFFLIVLQGWLLVVCSTLLYTTVIGYVPYEYTLEETTGDVISAITGVTDRQNVQISISQIRTCSASFAQFINSIHFWLVYYCTFSFLLSYLVRDERNLRLSLVVFTITMMGVYKENERMNCHSTPGCIFEHRNAATYRAYFSILSIHSTESHHENKLRALLTFVISILTEFLCGIVLGAAATFLPFPLVHPGTSLRASMRTIKQTLLHPLTMCIFDYLPRWGWASDTSEVSLPVSPRTRLDRHSQRPEWLRVADSVKISLSLAGSIVLYVWIYGNSGWSIPGPAILCFVAVFCDSHIEELEIALKQQTKDKCEDMGVSHDGLLDSATAPWWHSRKCLRKLQCNVFSTLIYGGIQRLIGTLAAALLGYITYTFASDGLWYLMSLLCSIFVFAFLRSYHVELFPPGAAETLVCPRLSKIWKAYICFEKEISKAGHAIGVACFYGCFFLVGIIHPSITPHEILTRIVKNVIAVAVYWVVSLLYNLCFVCKK